MTKIIISVIVSTFFLVSCKTSPVQRDRSSFLRLMSREISVGKGVEVAVEDRMRRDLAARSHVLMKFERIPSLEERRILKQLGVQLLDTVPERGFFASLPNDIELAKRLVAGTPAVQWIGEIRPQDKIEPNLRVDGVQDYAKTTDGRAHFIVLFFGDVDERDQADFLDRRNVSIVSRLGPINGWIIEIDEKAFLDFAKIDIVKWIESAPPPAEDDNDGVRSGTGVDSDSVSPPAPYATNGNGVILGQWEGRNASSQHADFGGRITYGDPPIPTFTRSWVHLENVAANNQYDTNEPIYVDMDDSAIVSAGDFRVTANAGFAAGTTVIAADADTAAAVTAYAEFTFQERYVDNVTVNFIYTVGEPIYSDVDLNRVVSVNDVRLLDPSGTFGAGTVVAAGDADIGGALRSFITLPHDHSTHVAGTLLGSGAQSVANGGSANQWAGVAPGATLRSYRANSVATFTTQYPDASANSVTLSTNSWGFSHHHQIIPPSIGYDTNTSYYDSVISGRQSDGSASGLNPILIFGSSGNRGRPERHADDITANGQYDSGEAIYLDNDDNGTVTVGDSRRLGAVIAAGTALIEFQQNEMHDESLSTSGLINLGEGIYRDTDGNQAVSAGDTRITPRAGSGLAAGPVALGDADVGQWLRQFRRWGNVRIPNSAKNTMVVANTRSDDELIWRSSSKGPTADGRLKPDITGPGSQAAGDFGVTSARPWNRYSIKTGTSMSTPAVSGVAALLTEWYRTSLLPGGPAPSTLRAILLHSAKDLNTAPLVTATLDGPDFVYGFGIARAEAALDLVPHHLTGTVAAVGNQDFTVTIGAMQELKVTLVWDDPAWTVAAAPSAVTGILQNDLDLELIAPDGTRYLPWILNPAQPSQAAVKSSFASGAVIPATARDRSNTVEQVVVDNAMAGDWTIRVIGSTLNWPPQTFSVASEAIQPEDSPTAGIPASDVWMRDNPTDTGTVPSTGSMWQSPALWNRIMDDGMAGHENPEFGHPNYLYATVRNRHATQIVRGATVEFWIAQASAGLVWPTNFQLVGRLSAPNLPAATSRQVGPLVWDPPSPSPSDHFCFYVRVTSPQDPVTFAEGPSVGTNARNSNNLVWKNVNIVNVSSSKTVTFLVRNTNRKRANIALDIEIPEAFLEVGEVFVKLSPDLERARAEQAPTTGVEVVSEPIVYPWYHEREDYPDRVAAGLAEPGLLGQTEPKERPTPVYRVVASRVSFPGILLQGFEAHVVSITFSSQQKEKAEYKIFIRERIGDLEIGGIEYRVRTGSERR